LIGCGQGHSIGFREILSNSFIKPFLELQLATYPYQHLQTPCNSSSQLPKARDELKRCKVLLAAELCKFIYKKMKKSQRKQETQQTRDMYNRPVE
jgi:RNA polymerase-interacting CarD/CdnL/TRCF family regulator